MNRKQLLCLLNSCATGFGFRVRNSRRVSTLSPTVRLQRKEIDEASLSLHLWTLLILAATTRAGTRLVLTVGEGQAGSDIAFWRPSLQATDKEDRQDRKMQHSHVRGPRSSAGLPATLCFSDFSRIHEESFIKLYLCCFSLSLSLSLQLQGGWMEAARLRGPGRSPLRPAEDDAGWEWRCVTSEWDGQPPLASLHAYRPPPLRSARRKSNVSQMRDFYRQAWGLVHWFRGISGWAE